MQTKNIDNVLVEKPFISLMELQRKKELKKIMVANNRLLDRIQSTVPSYDHVKWENDADHHVDILRNMTEFPEYFVPPGQHIKGRDMKIIDEERAAARENGNWRNNSASPSKSRAGKSSQSKQDSPLAQFSHPPTASAGYVPFSYFPEDQYAEYQRNLLLQQQQQQLNTGSAYGYGEEGSNFSIEQQQQQQQQQLYAYHNQQQQQQQRQQPQQFYTGNAGFDPSLPPVNMGFNGQAYSNNVGFNGQGYSNNVGFNGSPPQQQQQSGGVQLPDIYAGSQHSY